MVVGRRMEVVGQLRVRGRKSVRSVIDGRSVEGCGWRLEVRRRSAGDELKAGGFYWRLV